MIEENGLEAFASNGVQRTHPPRTLSLIVNCNESQTRVIRRNGEAVWQD